MAIPRGTKKLRNNFINRDRPTATNANVQLDGDCKLLLHLQSDYWAPFHSTQSINAPLPLLNMPPHFYSLLHCRSSLRAASVELACGRKLEIFTVPLKIMDLWWFQPHSCQLPPSPSDPVTTTELCLAYRKERRWINPLSISVVSLWMARSINQNVHTGHSFTAVLSSVFTNHTIEFTS